MDTALGTGTHVDAKLGPPPVPTGRHHAHKLPRTMSGFDISTLPDAEQMNHLVSTLRKTMRRSSEIRRSIATEQQKFDELDEAQRNNPEEISKFSERKMRLEIDLKRTEAFVRRYMTALGHLSDISCENVGFGLSESVPASPTTDLTPSASLPQFGTGRASFEL